MVWVSFTGFCDLWGGHGARPVCAEWRLVREGGGVADGLPEHLRFEQAAHDLTAARLGQAVHELDFGRLGDGANL